MYIQEIFITTNNHNQEEVLDQLNAYLGTLKRGGQIYKDFHPIIQRDSGFSVIVPTPEKTSLSLVCSTKYGREQKAKLEKIAEAELIITILGTDPDLEGITCECHEPSGYVLFTHLFNIGSPIRCSDCFGQIPLYHLNDDEGYYEIFSWKISYQSLDSLQMQCGVGEQFAIKQMSDFDSDLSKLGIKICKDLEEKTRKPVYYYLYNCRETPEITVNRSGSCPSCGNSWRLEERLHEKFDYKCDHCGLLSNVSWSSY